MLGDPSAISNLRKEGFDCIQLPLYRLMDLNEDEFSKVKEDIRGEELFPEVCVSPLPPDAYVSQRGFNMYVWTEFLKKAVRRASECGCKKIVWNDGRARVLPLEGDVGGIKEQVLQFLYLLCEFGDNFNISILVEPLGAKRTNFLNSMKEIDDFLHLVSKENISSVISLRELPEIGLEIENLNAYARLISHVQIENPTITVGDRRAPRREDKYDYGHFLNALQAMGYNGVITLPEDSARESLNYIRGLWEKQV